MEGGVVDLTTLQRANIISRNVTQVKVIASGTIGKAVTVKGLRVTRGSLLHDDAPRVMGVLISLRYLQRFNRFFLRMRLSTYWFSPALFIRCASGKLE